MSEGGGKMYLKEKPSTLRTSQQVAFLGVFVVFEGFSKTK